VEPVTHALTSLALARAGQKHLPRYGTSMLVAAGVAPDLDFANYLGGAKSFLRFDRTLLHSLLSSLLLACAIAGAFYFVAKKRDSARVQTGALGSPTSSSRARLGLGAAFVVCAIGIAGHLLLDLASGVGVQLLWPFRVRWFALDLLTELDPWILLVLAVGLLMPLLWRLVSEEIGERKRVAGGQRGAIMTLLVLLVYIGARGYLHSRALELLDSSDYHGRISLAAGAFPETLPMEWRGVVSTDNTIEEIEVSLAAGTEFDPEHSTTRFKPDDSPALQAGQRTAAAQHFLQYARFPLASVVRYQDGYRFELRDARFAANDASVANIMVIVEMRGNLEVADEQFRFASSRN
jgi:membrane-bound metal-dependent hydrolase YbcI (DUF457 family)